MSLHAPEFVPPGIDVEDAAGVYDLAVREKISALLVDADPLDSLALANVAVRSKQLEIAVTACRSIADAEALMSQRRFDVVFLEYWLGAETSVAFIHTLASRRDAPCIVLTDLDEPDIRRLAFRAGAYGFLSKDALCPQALESVTLAVLRPTLGAPPEPP